MYFSFSKEIKCNYNSLIALAIQWHIPSFFFKGRHNPTVGINFFVNVLIILL